MRIQQDFVVSVLLGKIKMTEKHSFGVKAVTCHAWNGSRTGTCISFHS